MEEEKKSKASKEKASSDGKVPALPQFGLAEEVLGTVNQNGSNGGSNGKRKGAGAGAEEGLMKFVTFYLGEEEYGLPISQVQEINRVAEITRVPNAPEHVRGVVNLRGKIVPVIELKNRLNLGQTDVGKESRIVVVENGPKIMGLMVDRVSQVLNIIPEQIEDAPEEVVKERENYIKGVGKMEERMILLLDLERVIGNTVRVQ